MEAQKQAEKRIRTSVTIPDELWERAKVTAARSRRSLQELVEEGLRQVVVRFETKETGGNR
jgi:predicted HicB family RNase H-like nuclease